MATTVYVNLALFGGYDGDVMGYNKQQSVWSMGIVQKKGDCLAKTWI
jgi:hypothetical protein